MHYGIGGFGMIAYWIVGIGVIALLAWGLLLVARNAGAGSPTPLQILKKRYASGEITKHQYEEMKKDLG